MSPSTVPLPKVCISVCEVCIIFENLIRSLGDGLSRLHDLNLEFTLHHIERICVASSAWFWFCAGIFDSSWTEQFVYLERGKYAGIHFIASAFFAWSNRYFTIWLRFLLLSAVGFVSNVIIHWGNRVWLIVIGKGGKCSPFIQKYLIVSHRIFFFLILRVILLGEKTKKSIGGKS